jgi:hypothetical protein
MDPRAGRLVLLHAEPPAMSPRSTIISGLAATACLLALGSCRDLAVEARELEDGGVPELVLHDGSVAPGSPPLGQALGTWYGFFLKPLLRRLDSGSYVIEVRLRSGLDLQRYSLTVAWLPESPCPA